MDMSVENYSVSARGVNGEHAGKCAWNLGWDGMTDMKSVNGSKKGLRVGGEDLGLPRELRRNAWVR